MCNYYPLGPPMALARLPRSLREHSEFPGNRLTVCEPMPRKEASSPRSFCSTFTGTCRALEYFRRLPGSRRSTLLPITAKPLVLEDHFSDTQQPAVHIDKGIRMAFSPWPNCLITAGCSRVSRGNPLGIRANEVPVIRNNVLPSPVHFNAYRRIMPSNLFHESRWKLLVSGTALVYWKVDRMLEKELPSVIPGARWALSYGAW